MTPLLIALYAQLNLLQAELASLEALQAQASSSFVSDYPTSSYPLVIGSDTVVAPATNTQIYEPPQPAPQSSTMELLLTGQYIMLDGKLTPVSNLK